MQERSVDWHDKAVELYLKTKDLDLVVGEVKRDRGWVRRHLIQAGVYQTRQSTGRKGQPIDKRYSWQIIEKGLPERLCKGPLCKGLVKFKPSTRYIFRCERCKKATAYL